MGWDPYNALSFWDVYGSVCLWIKPDLPSTREMVMLLFFDETAFSNVNQVNGPAVGIGQMEYRNLDKVPYFMELGFAMPMSQPDRVTGLEPIDCGRLAVRFQNADFAIKTHCNGFVWLNEKRNCGSGMMPIDEVNPPLEFHDRWERDVEWCRFVRDNWVRAPAAIDTGPPNLAWTRLGRSEIRRELEQSTFGAVFLGFDPNLRREVALRVPPPEALFTPELRARFRQKSPPRRFHDEAGGSHNTISPRPERHSFSLVDSLDSVLVPPMLKSGPPPPRPPLSSFDSGSGLGFASDFGAAAVPVASAT